MLAPQLLDAQLAERLGDAVPDLPRGETAGSRSNGDLLLHGRGDELVVRVLEQVPHMGRELGRCSGPGVEVADQYSPLGRFEETVEVSGKSALSGAVRSAQGEVVAR